MFIFLILIVKILKTNAVWSRRNERKHIQTFEMWCFKNNSKILDSVGIGREMWNVIMKRKVRLIEHSLKHLTMVSLMLEGLI